MPSPSFQPTPPAEDIPQPARARHYFDAAHGDVAALHDRIERGFTDYSLGDSPVSPTADRLAATIEFLSRSAGIVGLAGALTLIGIALF